VLLVLRGLLANYFVINFQQCNCRYHDTEEYTNLAITNEGSSHHIEKVGYMRLQQLRDTIGLFG